VSIGSTRRGNKVSDKGAALPGNKIGSIDDNLPFAPDGTKAASIAWRTWIYTDTGPKRTRYGYARIGQLLDVRGPPIKNDGCKAGWYRINPRGFVCIGKGATLDLKDKVIEQASVRPVRGQALPYLYGLADEPPPLLYFTLPSLDQMNSSEGEIGPRVARWRERAALQGLNELLGEPGAPPAFVANGQKLIKPYGVERPLRYVAHAGRARADSGFAIQQIFAWQKRVFGLTTEHDMIALDNIELVKASEVEGIALGDDEGLPVGFVFSRYAPKHVMSESGELRESGSFRYRQGLKLAGLRQGGVYETRDGAYVAGAALRIIAPRTTFPSFATGTRKWIDVSIGDQTLVAYVGQKPVYAAIVSTGRGGMGDPENSEATARGTFMIHSKHVSATMDGEEDKTDSIALRDVPFVQYFHKGYALHGTYWHDDFGRIRSHGCINLSPVDSAWLFEWTDPEVPPGWHGVINLERGTVVYVHG
jgi:lipoprotein-anchoring transpeptidase ErfK/SrfK